MTAPRNPGKKIQNGMGGIMIERIARAKSAADKSMMNG